MTNRLNKRPEPERDELVGKLLVASPFIHNYQPDVFLILQDSDNDVFGVNLVKQADEELAKAWEKTIGVEFDQQKLIHGGPHPGPVLAIHQNKQIAEQKISNGLFFSTRSESIDQLIESPAEPFRIVFGAVGWKKLQLEIELQAGLWLLVEPGPQDIFADPDELWFNSVRRYGLRTFSETVGISRFPESPILN